MVYVLDGVLIGAGDARYLALAGPGCLLAYAPVALLVCTQRVERAVFLGRTRSAS